MLRKTFKPFSIAAAVMLAMSCAAYAIDTDPGDYTWLPAGTTLGLLYFQNNRADTFRTGGSDVPDSKLSYNALAGRAVHYFDFAGTHLAVNATLPVVKFGDAEVGGADLPISDGIGDLRLGVSVIPIVPESDDMTGSTLGFTLFVTLPTGNYELGEVSSGTGTFLVSPQLGFEQGLRSNLFFNAYYDVTFAADHTESGLEVTQDPSHQLQTYLRYDFKPAMNVAVGYSARRGGRSYVAGAYTGQKTESDQLRLWASMFLTPTTQIAVRFDYDLKVEDGFKSEPLVQLRLAKLF